MISGYTVEIDGASETFRLTTRAMMEVESRLGKGIISVMEGMESGFMIGDLVTIFAASANNGKGRSVEWAQEAVDSIGFQEAGRVVGETATRAFPEADAASKNPQRAGKAK